MRLTNRNTNSRMCPKYDRGISKEEKKTPQKTY